MDIRRLVLLMAAGVSSRANPVMYSTDQLEVAITGNQQVPKYTFSLTDETPEFKIMFQRIDETEESKIVPSSNLALPSQDWEFVDNMAGEGRNFTITTSNKKRFKRLEFVNKIVDDYLKFDVVIEDYKWVSDTADTLNLYWKFSPQCTGGGGTEDEEEKTAQDTTTKGSNEPPPRHSRKLQEEEVAPSSETDSEICFEACDGDELCFSIVDTAEITTKDRVTTVPVYVAYSDDGMIQVSYKKFDGNMVHDPKITLIQGESRASRCGLFCRFSDFANK